MPDVRCPMSNVWVPMSDVRCVLSDVRCPMSVVWCPMSDVKCIHFLFSSDFRFLVHLLEIRSLLRMTLSFLRALTWICMHEKSGIRFVLSSAIIIEDCIYKHIRCGMLHRQSSVKICFLLLILSFCITINVSLRAFRKSKQTNKQIFLVRISIKRERADVFIFPYLRFLSVTDWMLSLQIVTPPPPRDKIELNTNLAYFDTCFEQRDLAIYLNRLGAMD